MITKVLISSYQLTRWYLAGGEDFPPILHNYCTITDCVERGVMYVPDGHGYHTDVPVYRLTEAYEEEKSLVESLLDDLLSKWETLSGMFTMEDTVRMICEPGYVDSTMSGARAVQEKLQNKEMDSFLKSPADGFE